MICPICRKPLEANDRLWLEWYEPCQWFVLHHDKMFTTGYLPSQEHSDKVDTYRNWCGTADHWSTHEARDTYRRMYANEPANQ